MDDDDGGGGGDHGVHKSGAAVNNVDEGACPTINGDLELSPNISIKA